eukprot:scaffold108767_cov48-Phaeocystis_antarctica.AAC.1
MYEDGHTLVHPRWQLRLECVGCTRLERVLHCGRAQQSRRPEIRCLLYLPLVPVSFRTVTDTSWVSSVLQVPSRIHGCRHPVSDQTPLDASRWTQRRRRDAGVCAERATGLWVRDAQSPSSLRASVGARGCVLAVAEAGAKAGAGAGGTRAMDRR